MRTIYRMTLTPSRDKRPLIIGLTFEELQEQYPEFAVFFDGGAARDPLYDMPIERGYSMTLTGRADEETCSVHPVVEVMSMWVPDE